MNETDQRGLVILPYAQRILKRVANRPLKFPRERGFLRNVKTVIELTLVRHRSKQ